MVCSLLAPMFSVEELTLYAISAISSIAFSEKFTFIPSVDNKALYCLIIDASGSVKIRLKSATLKDSSSTLIGNLPWSSGIKSEGLATWKAPAAIKRIWSVLTAPYLVMTVDPSTRGSMSLWTPPLETSGPPTFSLPAILSISSRNTMPSCSVLLIASCTASSWSIRFW